MDKFDQLRAIIKKTLDDKEGCEWIKSKSIQDIGSYTLEEIYELLDALENKNSEAVKDELADLAFHLLLYAEIGEKQGDFTLEDILDAAIEKQQDRRLSLEKPVVSAEEAHVHWTSQKNKTRDKSQGVLADIPENMSALVRSKKIQDRAADVSFDWDDAEQIFNKINEELNEFKVELKNQDQEAMLDELGDILFTVVNIGRHCNIDAEQALRYANNKFLRRFQLLEREVVAKGHLLESMDFKALLELWEDVKKSEKYNNYQ